MPLPRIRLLLGPGTLHSRGADRMDFTRYSRSGNPRMTGDELLATLPSPEETLALRPSPKLQARMTELLEKNRTSGLTTDEGEEIRHYELAEHLVRMAKGRALVKLKGP